jgi:hypothetical protein
MDSVSMLALIPSGVKEDLEKFVSPKESYSVCEVEGRYDFYNTQHSQHIRVTFTYPTGSCTVIKAMNPHPKFNCKNDYFYLKTLFGTMVLITCNPSLISETMCVVLQKETFTNFVKTFNQFCRSKC